MSDLAGRRELAVALTDAEAAFRQLDETVARIRKQHDPLGCLPFVLAVASGAIAVGVTARSLRWYWVVLLAVVGSIGTWFALSLFRFVSWSRHHPLLARAERIHQLGKRGEEANDELLELGRTIVQKYLPETESKMLLARLDDATERTAALLGFDGGQASLPDERAGA